MSSSQGTNSRRCGTSYEWKQSLTHCKIKCCGDKSGCARCATLKIECVYDDMSKPGPQKPDQSMSPTVAMKSNWSIQSSSKTSSSNEVADAAVHEQPFTAESSSAVRTTTLEGALGPVLCDDSSASINLMTDDTTLGDPSDKLDWALTNDDYATLGDVGDTLDWALTDDDYPSTPDLIACKSNY